MQAARWTRILSRRVAEGAAAGWRVAGGFQGVGGFGSRNLFRAKSQRRKDGGGSGVRAGRRVPGRGALVAAIGFTKRRWEAAEWRMAGGLRAVVGLAAASTGRSVGLVEVGCGGEPAASVRPAAPDRLCVSAPLRETNCNRRAAPSIVPGGERPPRSPRGPFAAFRLARVIVLRRAGLLEVGCSEETAASVRPAAQSPFAALRLCESNCRLDR